jgi:hypothetical protein
VGLERGPLSLVSTTEELLGRNSNGFGLENRDYSLRDSSRWPRGTLCPQKVGTNFADERRSLGRYSSPADWCVFLSQIQKRFSNRPLHRTLSAFTWIRPTLKGLQIAYQPAVWWMHEHPACTVPFISEWQSGTSVHYADWSLTEWYQVHIYWRIVRTLLWGWDRETHITWKKRLRGEPRGEVISLKELNQRIVRFLLGSSQSSQGITEMLLRLTSLWFVLTRVYDVTSLCINTSVWRHFALY